MNRTLAKIFTVTMLLMVPALAFALQGAHDPATGGRNFTCNSCHTGSATAVLYNANNVCVGCHVGANDSLGVQKKSFSINDYKSIGADTNYGGGAVAGRTPGKNTSHKWLGPDVVPAAKALAPTDSSSINQYGMNRKGVTGQILCVRCHAVHSDSQNNDPVDYDQSKQAPYVRALNTKDQMCLDCHRQRNTQTTTAGTHPVLVSYTSASVKAKANATPSQFKLTNGKPFVNTTNPTAEMKLKKSVVVCSSCHGVHYADSDSATFDNHSTNTSGGLSNSSGALLRVSLKGANNDVGTINLCTNCHTKQHANQVKQHAATSTIQCTDCHNAHVDTIDPTDPVQTPNAYLLRRYMNYSGISGAGGTVQLSSYRKRAVYTDANLTTARWADATGTGICQACHNLPTSEPKHAQYAGDPSKTRVNCQECHTADAPHTDTPPTAPNCTVCHGQPPQLSVSGDTTNGGTLGGYSPGYTRYTQEATTPHQSHALGTGTNYAYACTECHLGSTHNNTYVEVFLVKPAKAGASATYNPSANGSTASTCSTVYCHSNGNGTYSTASWFTSGTGSKGSIIGLAPATRCTTCHASTAIATGSHSKHVTTMGYGCVTCHASTVSDNTTLLPAAYGANGTHVNAVKDVSYSGTGGAVGSSCSSVKCHSNGVLTTPVTVPTWGNAASGACNTCHYTATSVPSLASNAHSEHITVIGTGNSSCVTCHSGFAETAATHANGTVTPGTGCASCHGATYAVTWTSTNPTKDTCTKCHGTLTDKNVITAAANNRYLVAPGKNVAGLTGTVTGNGQVSSDAKVGAHQTHLRYLNGFSNYSTVDYRCESCHGALSAIPANGNHANGSSTPAFQKMATLNGAITTASFSAGSCSNVYCHNPKAAGIVLDNGTAMAPSWTDATYIADNTKSVANCQKCHLVPGSIGFSKSGSHSGSTDTPSYTCNGCHGHNGDNTGIIGQRHIDGIRYVNAASSGCDGCHAYNAADWSNYGTTYTLKNTGGVGAHAKHITFLTTKRFGTTIVLDPADSTAYAKNADSWNKVCGICHGSTAGNHQNTAVNVIMNTTDYNFGSNALYNGAPGGPVANKTCSNLSCHYFTSPQWSN